MQRENKWQERFDENFAHNIIAVDDVQVITFIDTPQYQNIRQFIQSEITRAVAEERDLHLRRENNIINTLCPNCKQEYVEYAERSEL